MGILSELLLLPIAPARTALWAVRRAVDVAEQEYYGPAAVRAQLAELYRALDEGSIPAEEFDVREAELLDRLDEGRARGIGP